MLIYLEHALEECRAERESFGQEDDRRRPVSSHHGWCGGAGATEDYDGGGHHDWVAADHVGNGYRIRGDVANCRADGGWNDLFHYSHTHRHPDHLYAGETAWIGEPLNEDAG